MENKIEEKRNNIYGMFERNVHSGVVLAI